MLKRTFGLTVIVVLLGLSLFFIWFRLFRLPQCPITSFPAGPRLCAYYDQNKHEVFIKNMGANGQPETVCGCHY